MRPRCIVFICGEREAQCLHLYVPSCVRRVFEKNGARVIVDDLSSSFLQSCTIDWEKSVLRIGISLMLLLGLIREAFKVSNNAKAESSCSCGTSFAPKS